MLPQTGTKLTKKRGSIFGALLWRHLTPQINRNIVAQLQSILYTTAEERFWKFSSCRTFGAHKLAHFELFLDYFYEL